MEVFAAAAVSAWKRREFNAAPAAAKASDGDMLELRMKIMVSVVVVEREPLLFLTETITVRMSGQEMACENAKLSKITRLKLFIANTSETEKKYNKINTKHKLYMQIHNAFLLYMQMRVPA